MDLLYLNAMDIEKLELSNEEILGAVEQSLKAQGDVYKRQPWIRFGF